MRLHEYFILLHTEESKVTWGDKSDRIVAKAL